MGRVHAIGCMVGAPDWATWAPKLQRIDSEVVDVGLHLDLTEYPLQRRPGRLSRLVISSGLGTLSRTAIRSEICAQLDAFEWHMGRAPSYVDGHQHVHQLPVVRDELVNELQHRYAARLPWLRRTRPATDASPGWRQALKAQVIAALGSKGLAVRARRFGFQQNTHLLGVHDFTANEGQYLGLLHRWLQACQRGDLLMCHPSLVRSASDPISGARMVEYRVLSGEAFGALVRDQGLVLQAISATLAQDAEKRRRASQA
jgi:predicted glycoside hydrolase/deacetylase ChbG (UPF0249 family)